MTPRRHERNEAGVSTREDVENLIGRVALGDRAAFSALYSATSAKLFGVILRVLDNRTEAEEVLQEVYLRVWRNAGRYKVNGLSPMTWLITIARNAAVDRRRRRGAVSADIGAVAAQADSRPGPEQEAIAASENARLAECLEELSDGHADAVRGAYLDGETYADLASRFEVPLNTMRTWLRRSLLTLRECLSR